MRQLNLRPRYRVLAGAVAVLVTLTAAIGWMHTHAGRRLLARLGVQCPVTQVAPERVAAVRAEAMARARGTGTAASRPALGLQLDTSSETAVAAWAASVHAPCEAITRGYRFLRCRGVPAAALGLSGPAVSEIWFSFGNHDRLIAVNLYRRYMTEAETRQSWFGALGRLQQQLGEPTQASGDLTLAHLADSALAVARVRYAYSDYIATVTASRTPYGGMAVREQYMSALPST
jgi:hypothetical protein